MGKTSDTLKKAITLLQSGAVIVSGAEYDSNDVLLRVQLYFLSDGEAVMDVVNKDDLVQNFPDEEGCYTLAPGAKNAFRKVTMFEGDEDMYFRVDGTKTQADDLGELPTVEFLEALESISALKI